VTGEFTLIFNKLGELTTFAPFRPRSQVLPPSGLTGISKTSYVEGVPSPVGHALGGLIVAWGLAPNVASNLASGLAPNVVRHLGPAPTALLICAVAGVLPDVDFAWSGHNRETHSIGAAVIAGAIVFAWKRNATLALAVALSWLTHVLFDWLGSDDTPPLGVMALWPMSSNFHFADAFVFEAISRRYWLDNFVTHNVWAVMREILILGPLCLLVWRWRSRTS
jgi:hypothetical protein